MPAAETESRYEKDFRTGKLVVKKSIADAEELKYLKSELRLLRHGMKVRGISRRSVMNGGHSAESMRANEECFRLESMIKKLKKVESC